MLDREEHLSPFPVLTEEEKEDAAREWADYVPDPIYISEERRQELREEHDRYIAELFEEIGEPPDEVMAQAEAWWRPIEEHLTKNSSS